MTDEGAEVPMLVLATYHGHLEIVAHPTSRVLRANCGHLAWLSPPGEAIMDRGAYTTCEDCYELSVLPEGAEKVAVPGAVESLEALWGMRIGDAVREELRRRGIRES